MEPAIELRTGGGRWGGWKSEKGRCRTDVEEERRREREEKRSGDGRGEEVRGLRGALLFDSGRTVAENTNGRIMKMVLCDAATTLAPRDSSQQ